MCWLSSRITPNDPRSTYASFDRPPCSGISLERVVPYTVDHSTFDLMPTSAPLFRHCCINWSRPTSVSERYRSLVSAGRIRLNRVDSGAYREDDASRIVFLLM